MSRCDYCEYRNSWDCDDGWGRISNNYFCESFKLDYDSLSEKQKKEIQRKLIEIREEE